MFSSDELPAFIGSFSIKVTFKRRLRFISWKPWNPDTSRASNAPWVFSKALRVQISPYRSTLWQKPGSHFEAQSAPLWSCNKGKPHENTVLERTNLIMFSLNNKKEKKMKTWLSSKNSFHMRYSNIPLCRLYQEWYIQNGNSPQLVLVQGSGTSPSPH